MKGKIVKGAATDDQVSTTATPVSETVHSTPTGFGTSLEDARAQRSTTVRDISSILLSGERARAEALAAGEWHIANTTPGQLDLNIGDIWDDYTGRSVTVGVYDSGIEANHPDLDDNYNANLHFAGDNPGPDYNWTSSTGVPIGANDAHGTAVAGIIAAEQNGAGTVGVAYGASVTSVDTVAQATVSNFSSFITGMSRFDIVNRSSGVSTQFQNARTDISAYETAVSQGRGGRGTIIVESAGNDRVFGDLNADGAQQSTDAGRSDANSNSANNGHLAIVVGSVNETGTVDTYSSPGANLLVSAFGTSGNVVTTDLVGTNGYRTSASLPAPNEINGGDYTGSFNGTSAATPMVSGIVALMLDANPNLGWRDVQQILALTARHVGSDMDADPAGAERFSWTYNKADNWNGGGMHFSNDYGYGLVDAHAAVRLAESWTLQSTSINEQVGLGYKFPGRIALTEANTVPNEFKITIGDNINTESISLWLNLDHQRMSDLRIEIRSPEGTWSVLTDRTGLGGVDYAVAGATGWPLAIDESKGWTFTSNAFRGETAKGEWTIRIWDEADSGSGDNGTISGLILKTYGSAATVNDQLYYTDEYGAVWSEAIAEGNFGRLQITDTDGGIDTINAAATTSDAQIDLTQGQISLIAGGYAQVAIGSVIENAFGGDGNDILYGNEQTNLLKGNRGNDTIYGRGGADTLQGDQGDDILLGGAGGDHIHGGAGNDTANYTGSRSGVSIVLGDQQANSWNGSASGGDAADDRLYSIENLTGSRWIDTLTGNNADNFLNGGGGADVMSGGGRNDTYYVDNAGDVVNEEVQFGTRSGIFSTRYGYKDAGGVDTVITSLSTYDLSKTSSHDLAFSSVGATLFGSVENLRYNGTGSFVGTGNDLDNIIEGGALSDTLFGRGGKDTLDGKGGADLMKGGAGDDTYIVDHVSDVVSEMTGLRDATGIDEVKSYLNSYSLGTHVENLTFIGTGSFTGTGNWLDNRITGGSSADVLTGGLGNDVLIGNGGDDVLRGGIGSDSYALGSGKNIAYIDNGTVAGGDIVDGTGDGDDTVVADESTVATGLRLNLFSAGTALTSDVVSAAFASSAIDVEKVVGNSGNDLIDASRLLSNDQVWVVGELGNDTVISGVSAEWFDGGADYDTIVYSGLQSEYDINTFSNGLEELISIQNIATGAIDYFKDVELAQFGFGGAFTTVDLLDFLHPHILGTAGADQLVGTNRDDLIEGLAGADSIAGGLGHDRLLAGDGEDILIIDAQDSEIDGGSGYDYARADDSSAGLTLDLAQSSIEYVDGSKNVDTFDYSASVLADFIEANGNAGADRFIDGAGTAWFDGGEGDDVMVFAGYSTDFIVETDAHWTGWTAITNKVTGIVDWTIGVEKMQFSDTMIDDPTASHYISGTPGAEVLQGTDGSEVLVGGAGADQFHAGAGNDAIYVDLLDTVIDGGEGWDVLYVSEDTNQSGLQFDFAGTNIEYVWSGLGNDTIDARGIDSLAGFWYGIESHGGDDTLFAGDTQITFSGGAGFDVLNLAGNSDDWTFAIKEFGENASPEVLITNKITGVIDYAYSVEAFNFDDGSRTFEDLRTTVFEMAA